VLESPRGIDPSRTLSKPILAMLPPENHWKGKAKKMSGFWHHDSRSGGGETDEWSDARESHAGLIN
jgi:hypothetical protein